MIYIYTHTYTNIYNIFYLSIFNALVIHEGGGQITEAGLMY